MSANTTCYVLVEKATTEVVEVSAVTLAEAEKIALSRSGVISVLQSSYSREELEGDYFFS